jgi:hypothetical protein
MTLKGVFDRGFSKFIQKLIRDPIVIVILLGAIPITKFIEGLCPALPVVGIVIIFEEFWIIIWAINYSWDLLTELFINVIRNVRKIRNL